MYEDTYHLEQESHGRGGWVFYVGQSRLAFPWEMMASNEDVIRVPEPGEWDDYCET